MHGGGAVSLLVGLVERAAAVVIVVGVVVDCFGCVLWLRGLEV